MPSTKEQKVYEAWRWRKRSAAKRGVEFTAKCGSAPIWNAILSFNMRSWTGASMSPPWLTQSKASGQHSELRGEYFVAT